MCIRLEVSMRRIINVVFLLLLVSAPAAAQAVDPPRARRPAGIELGPIAQILVGPVGLRNGSAWNEERGHARRRRWVRGVSGLGYFLRSSGVIWRIVNDPSSTCWATASSFNRRWFSARSR